jgi:ribonuclease P protein component
MVSPRARLRLTRAMRVRDSRDFAVLRAQGKRMTHGCLIANWKPAAEGRGSRLGVVTGRRLGSAVVRNRARRLLREAFRIHQHELARPVEAVLVARPSIANKSFALVERDFLQWLQRADLLKQP